MSLKKQKLLIIDSNALVHRAFHAIPPTLTDEQGRMTNAVYGFTAIFLKSIKDLKPDYVAATFDRKEKTFRHEEFTEYKATRTKAPDELYDQIPLVKEVLKAFDVPIFELAGFEADDLIGTIAELKTVDRPDIESIILTGDQDCLQLVDYNTKVLSPHKGLSETILYGEAEVKEKFGGLEPKQLIDYKGLRGDPSDNIPGVKGIGEKGAIELLNDFGSIEGIYKNIESPKIKDRIRNLLKDQKEQALMSKKIATIIRNAPIDFKLKDCKFAGFDQNKVIAIFQELGFKRLMSQVATLAKSGLIVPTGQGSLFGAATKTDKEKTSKSETSVNAKIGQQDYRLIAKDGLKDFFKELHKQKEFCFDTETTGLDPFGCELLGISFCWQAGLAHYLPVAILTAKDQTELKGIFSDEKVKKIGHNLKFDLEVLNTYFSDGKFSTFTKGGGRGGLKGIYFDTMVASYLLNSSHRQHNLDTLAFVEFGYQMQPIEDLIGKGKDQINMSEVPTEKISWYSGEDADLTFRLYQKFLPELKKENLLGLFEKLEMPLVEVLAEMEKNGVKINAKQLNKLSGEFDERIKAIERKAWKMAGEEFNLASPKQLKEILFDKLEISTAGIGKTKTGLSTAAGELEKLQGQHEIIDLIIEFRELSKLKSTYLDALPALISKLDGRVHTSFNQTVTTTGRLSSSEPNLQNIPIRTETGGQIRKAFTAEKGFKIVKADYSQIELRIIASLANDQKMLEIFNSGGDIHTQTAAIIHNIKPSEVTKEIRRTAKEVNFGVLYGMGAWGLASRTGISNNEAQEFIFKYFQTFSGVKKWLEETIEIARDKGYVETIYGRRRFIPEINSSVNQVRNSAERMAVNMPIQGSAADMIKLAMIEIQKELPKVSPKSSMILQVHDELVFEVPEKEVKKVAKFIDETMCSVMKLRAPIEAEVSAGDNWGETEPLSFRT
jgi:DNA polymerase I